MKQILERMKNNGFEMVELDTAEQAKEYLLKHIPAETTVGVGGSVSVRQTGVLAALLMQGCEVFSHWDVEAKDVPRTHQMARAADVYLTSANALTKHGELVLIDGVGNRVGAIVDGPKHIYFIVSRSKMVDGGYSAAIARIKKIACPPNARRLHLDTPCALTDVCNPKACGDACMCRVTLVVDRVPRGRKITVLFIKEKLGY